MGYYGIPCKAAKRVNCLPIKCKITKPMTLTDIATHTVHDDPHAWLNFLSMVISGKNLDQDKSDRQQRLVSSLGQDSSYNATNGQWMMPKQLGLGFAMWHLTGSEHVVTILNRYLIIN